MSTTLIEPQEGQHRNNPNAVVYPRRGRSEDPKYIALQVGPHQDLTVHVEVEIPLGVERRICRGRGVIILAMPLY